MIDLLYFTIMSIAALLTLCEAFYERNFPSSSIRYLLVLSGFFVIIRVL